MGRDNILRMKFWKLEGTGATEQYPRNQEVELCRYRWYLYDRAVQAQGGFGGPCVVVAGDNYAQGPAGSMSLIALAIWGQVAYWPKSYARLGQG